MKMVLRSMYLDPELDGALAGRAHVEGITKAELMRRFLQEGLTRPSTRFQTYLDSSAPAPAAAPSNWVAKDRERAVASTGDRRSDRSTRPAKPEKGRAADKRVSDEPVRKPKGKDAARRKRR